MSHVVTSTDVFTVSKADSNPGHTRSVQLLLVYHDSHEKLSEGGLWDIIRDKITHQSILVAQRTDVFLHFFQTVDVIDRRQIMLTSVDLVCFRLEQRMEGDISKKTLTPVTI